MQGAPTLTSISKYQATINGISCTSTIHVNGSFQVINYVLGFEVIKSGEYKGLLLGNRSFIREGLGRVWGDILFNEDGERLKELSEADANGNGSSSYRQRGMSVLNCSACDYQSRDGRRAASRIDASLAEGFDVYRHRIP